MLDLADLSGRMPFLMQVQRDLCLLSSSSRDLLLLAKCVNHYIVDISNELKKIYQWIEILGCDFPAK